MKVDLTIARILSAALLAVSAATFAAPVYQIVSLSPPSGYTGASANGINNAGDVVGVATLGTEGASNAMYWAAGTTTASVLAVPASVTTNYPYFRATVVSNSGFIAGMAQSPIGGASVMLRWRNPAAVATVLSGLPEGNAAPVSINSSGAFVGTVAQDYIYYPARWGAGGKAHELPGFQGTNASTYVYGINDSGIAVGGSQIEVRKNKPFEQAVVWFNPTTLYNLGHTLGYEFSVASAINNSGEVVGTLSTVFQENLLPFFWSSGSGLTLIPTLPGGYNYSFLPGKINNGGEVIGGYNTTANQYHPFLWTAAAGTVDVASCIDLTDPMYSTLNAAFQVTLTGLNDSGVLVGYYMAQQGDAPKAFMLVPE